MIDKSLIPTFGSHFQQVSSKPKVGIKGGLQWKNDLGLYCSLVILMNIGVCDIPLGLADIGILTDCGFTS